MRILTLTKLFPNDQEPTLGVFVKERMKAVAKRVDVRVVAPVPWFPPIRLISRWYPFSQIPRTETREGMHVEHPRFVVIPKIGRWVNWLTYFVGVARTIIRERRSRDFDLLDVHFAYPDGVAGVLLGRLTGKPVVITVRGSDVHSFPRDPVLRLLIRSALKRADLVIAVSGALAEQVVRLGVPDARVAVVGNGVDADRFRPIDRLQARRALRLHGDKKIILSVGSMLPLKGFHLIVEAAALLKERGGMDDLQFVFVGGPIDSGHAYADELRRRIDALGVADRVSLVGRQPHDEMCRWYNAADLFCLASSHEGWPNVVMESLACGVPVVATKVWGTPEALHSEEFGILVDGRSGPALARAIGEALERQWDRDAIVRHARTRTWDKVADSVLMHFGRVVESWRGRRADSRI